MPSNGNARGREPSGRQGHVRASRRIARAIPAKSLVADALIYCRLAWTTNAGIIMTAVALADRMFGTRRTCHPSQQALAATLGVYRNRIGERLAVLCRDPNEKHDLAKHVFIRSYPDAC